MSEPFNDFTSPAEHTHVWEFGGGFNTRGAAETSGQPGLLMIHITCSCGAKKDVTQEEWDAIQEAQLVSDS